MALIQPILDKQAAWHSKSLQGCLYASYAYKNLTSEVGFDRICLPGKVNKKLFLSIVQLIDIKIKDPKNYVMSITLPGNKTFGDLLSFIDFCKLETNWLVDDKKNHKNLRLVKIRIPLLPSVKESKPSFAWMLGFGPFNFFPKTRQSPFFEILVPTKSKEYMMKMFHRFTSKKHYPDSIERGGSPHDAHVADIYIDGITNNSKIDSIFWNGSINRKQQLLTDTDTFSFDDTNAKAGITFSYPV